MNYLDIGIILLGVILLIYGLIRGLHKQLFEVLSFVGILTALFFSIVPLANLISTNFGGNELVFTIVTPLFTGEAYTAQFGGADGVTLTQLLTVAGLPLAIAEPTSGLLMKIAPSATTLGGILATLIGLVLFYIISFIVIMLILKIILSLINQFFLWLIKIKFFKYTDKVLGLVFSLGMFYVVICVAFAGIDMLPTDFAPELQLMVKGLIESSQVAKPIYDNNIIGQLLQSLFV